MTGYLNSLGFPKPPAETRVVVAMSGGVDSSVVTAMLAREGYDVIGITLQLYDHGLALAKKGACCAGQDIYDARKVCDHLNLPHYILDYENKFSEEVIDDFADSYLRGETPIPCVRCNQTVKFRDLVATAQELEADCLATGHYVQRQAHNNDVRMLRGADPVRDQSYFLFATTRLQMDYLRFPLGGFSSKAQTRAIAEAVGLEIADKPDSQDICFVPGGNYADVVARRRPEARQPGKIVDMSGQVIGDHKGLIHFTIGQRRGLEIGGLTEPLYVVGLKSETNEVIAGPKHALARSQIHMNELNWLGDGESPPAQLSCTVKLRSTRPPATAHLQKSETGWLIKLEDSQYGISPGQAAVFYDGEQCLGGGWIVRTEH